MASREEIAQLLDTTPRQIDEWMKAGIIPAPIKKEYNPALCVRAALSHFRDKADASTVQVNRRELAGWLDLSERRVSQLATEGIFPKATAAGYPLRECITAYCRFARQEREEANGYRAGEEKARLTMAQAEKTEFELAVLRREYVNRAEVERAFVDAAMSARAKALSMPVKLAPLVVGIDDINTAKDLLETGIHEMLMEITNPPDLSGTNQAAQEESAVD